jgi:hypothetical protein
LVEVINRSAAYPTFDTSPLKKAAANQLTSIERLARYMADRRTTLGEAEVWALLQARQDGINSVNQCYRDQASTHIPCQTKCQEQHLGHAEQEACIEKCELPKSCTTPPPEACNEFEAAIAPR